jgi:uncharacterized membrane protein
MDSVARKLQEWLEAEVIDAATADRIRSFESSRGDAGGFRWPILLAIAFGAVMVSAGVLLFVAAHWDRLSPFARMTLIIALVLLFHSGGAVLRRRFEEMAIAAHALGTVALGAALYLTGQIYHLDTEWSTGAMLWTLGAVAAWALLRHWPQAAIAAVLFPYWLTVEYTEFLREQGIYRSVPAAAAWLMLAFTYLSARIGDQTDPVRRALVWIGALILLPAAIITSLIDHRNGRGGTEDWLAYGVGAALSLALAFVLRREQAVWNIAAVAWVLVLALLEPRSESVLRYIWLAAGSTALAAWGIYERRTERINLGVAGFALTVLFFYFASIMDKIGRSASLIGLGILFLAGGYALERVRRRLVGRISGGAA